MTTDDAPQPPEQGASEVDLQQAMCCQAPTPRTEEPATSKIDKLPPDIVILIIDHLFLDFVEDCRPWDFDYGEYDWSPWHLSPHHSEVWKDIAHLARTCRRLYNVVTPSLYWLDVHYNCASSLLISAKKNFPSAVLKALEAGADIDAVDMTQQPLPLTNPRCTWWSLIEDERWHHEPVGLAALHWACRLGHEEVVKLLVERGATLNNLVQTADGGKVASVGNFRCGSILYLFGLINNGCVREHEVNVGIFLQCSANALYFALLESHTEPERATGAARTAIAKQLVQAGSPLITHTGVGLHAIHQACADWNIEMVRWLLDEAGVDVNTTDSMDNTPLHHVGLCYNFPATSDPGPVIRLLLQRGANINARNVAGRSALSLSLHFMRVGYWNDGGENDEHSKETYRVAIALIKAGARLPKGISKKYKERPEAEREQFRQAVEESRALGLPEEPINEWTSSGRKITDDSRSVAANHWVYGLMNFGAEVPEELTAGTARQWCEYWKSEIPDESAGLLGDEDIICVGW
ncbi:hypothetical protein ACJ41O_013789 [Fusarium nematophilum]